MKKRIAIVIFTLLVLLGGKLVVNHVRVQYKTLNETDKKALAELDSYYKNYNEEFAWTDFALPEKPLVLMNGRFGNVYLVNPVKKPPSIFAAKIRMPEDSSLEVYRLAYNTPKIFLTSLIGRFNTIDGIYEVFGNEVYYFRYDKKNSFDTPYPAEYFIPMLAHEAFHYYMQTEWGEGSTYEWDYSSLDIELLEKEYEIMEKIRVELKNETPSKEKLLEYTDEYLEVMKQRIEASPAYVKKELERETVEGTAEYVGIIAAQAIDYDYGVMCFNGRKDVPFTEIIPAIKADQIKEYSLIRRIPYDVGAMLCQLMDELEIPNWQKILNQQTKDNRNTLYNIICDYRK